MKVTVLAYEPTWAQISHLFIRFFTKNWVGQVAQIVQGNGDWSTAAANHFTHSHDDATVLLLDDYILADRVNAAKVQLCWDFLLSHKTVGFVRLNPCPGPEVGIDGFLGEFDKGKASYLTSLQPAIWRRECLLDLLVPGESAWDFELRGTERARECKWNFYGTYSETLVPNQNLMRSGVLVPEVMEWIKQQSE